MTLLPHVPTILLLFGSRSYGSPAAPLISSVPLCFCGKCVSGLMIGQMGDLKTLRMLELRQPSHRRKPSPLAMSCQTCGSLTMFHLSKRWRKLRIHWEKLPTSSVSAGFRATDLMLKSKYLQILCDIPIFL